MKPTKGYIYIRYHKSYDLDDVCKLGKATNIPERDTTYATGELKRGHFEYVFEVSFLQMSIIERLLQFNFKHLNVIYDGGTEFYKKSIVTLIEPYLIEKNINYKLLSKEEVNKLIRTYRLKKKLIKITKLDLNLIKEQLRIFRNKRQLHSTITPNILQSTDFKPRDDQEIIITNSLNYFNNNDKGLLVLMCGIGKTLISLWIFERLKYNTLLIGVPNILLIKQWQNMANLLFPNIPCLIVNKGIFNDVIQDFIIKNKSRLIIITTYASSHRVKTATNNIDFKFDFKINDEVHHLTSTSVQNNQSTRKYINMLEINANKQLSLTATLKYIYGNSSYDTETYDNQNIISNNSIEYFGEIIEKRNLIWAINNNILCDYSIQTIIVEEEQLENIFSLFNIVNQLDKQLFLSAYCSLKSIYDKYSHHILIYCNTLLNTQKIINYINLLITNNIFKIDNLYCSNYHSNMNENDKKIILSNFEKSKIGILSNVECLGEGWDLPLLDAVVFSENMISNIRIVQSALRASRKDRNDINKKSKIILPVLNSDDFLNESNDNFKKIKEVIYQLSTEDEGIIQKIKVFKSLQTEQIKTENTDKNNNLINNSNIIYDDNLTNKLLLKTIKRINIYISYSKAKQIISEKNIHTKQEYYNLCNNDFRLPINPEIIFKNNFINWIDYLGLYNKFYNIEACKEEISKYINNYNNDYLDIYDICKNLSENNNNLPPIDLWLEYYNLNNFNDLNISNHHIKIFNKII